MPSLWAIAVGVVTTLVATAILTYVRQRRLFIVVSTLFRHSSLPDEGTIVQLSLVNRGIKTEEEIEITLDRQLRYELVASTGSKVLLQGDTLAVPRLPANDQIQFVLLVDGGTFSPASIQGVTSRETKGTIVEELEKLPLSAGATLMVIGMLVGIAGVGFLGGYFSHGLLREFRDTQKLTADTAAMVDRLEISEEERARITALESEGWRGVEAFLKSDFSPSYIESLPVNIDEVRRTGDVAEVTATFSNTTDELLRVSSRLISPAGETDEIDLTERSIRDCVITPHASRQVHLKAYLPPGFPEQTLIGEFTVQSRGAIAFLEKYIQVD